MRKQIQAIHEGYTLLKGSNAKEYMNSPNFKFTKGDMIIFTKDVLYMEISKKDLEKYDTLDLHLQLNQAVELGVMKTKQTKNKVSFLIPKTAVATYKQDGDFGDLFDLKYKNKIIKDIEFGDISDFIDLGNADIKVQLTSKYKGNLIPEE